MELTNGMDRGAFHDKAWALYQAKALADAKLPKLSLYAIRTLWNALYDSMPVSTAPTTRSAPEQWKAGDDTSSVQISRDGSTHKWGCKCGGCAALSVNPVAGVIGPDQRQAIRIAIDLAESNGYPETCQTLRALLAASMGGDRT